MRNKGDVHDHGPNFSMSLSLILLVGTIELFAE